MPANGRRDLIRRLKVKEARRLGLLKAMICVEYWDVRKKNELRHEES